MRSRFAGSPTVTLVGLLAVVYVLLQQVVGTVAGPFTARSLFALSTPVAARPWTVFASVYAHGNLGHLLANVLALVVVGYPLERETTPVRFHAFFALTGALAGLAEVWFAAVVGSVVPGIVAQVNVLGASGAVLALLGYLLTSNRLTDRVVGRFEVSPRAQIALFAVVATLITAATATRQVALVAHFTGLLLGLSTGRLHVLRGSPDRAAVEPV